MAGNAIRLDNDYIGGVELSKDEAYTLYTQGQYIVTRSRIYQICFGGKGGRIFSGA